MCTRRPRQRSGSLARALLSRPTSFSQSGMCAQTHTRTRTRTKRGHENTSCCVAFYFRIRPYCAESTASHLNSEVKLRQAALVLGWATTRESAVLYPFWPSFFFEPSRGSPFFPRAAHTQRRARRWRASKGRRDPPPHSGQRGTRCPVEGLLPKQTNKKREPKSQKNDHRKPRKPKKTQTHPRRNHHPSPFCGCLVLFLLSTGWVGLLACPSSSRITPRISCGADHIGGMGLYSRLQPPRRTFRP